MTEIILFEDQFDGQWYATDWGWLPNDWEGWWFDNKNRPPDKGWLEHRPEYGCPDPNHANADKQILSPPRTVQYGKLWATVWAGITRRYEGDIQGKLLECGMWGYVLAGGGNHDDPTRPGRMQDMVGIDPEGGNNGLSNSIVWGEPLENLVRGFDSDPNWQLYTAHARATHDYVSVFTHFHPEWPIEHLGPLFDNFYLKVIEEEEPECWGQPRIQYLRRYYVVDSYAAFHRMLNALEVEGADLPTGGPSSDDAGMGMVDNKTAIECDRSEDAKDNYREFYATEYPHAKLEFRSFGTEEPEMALFSQRDPRWRDYVYGGGTTLGAAGCLITAISMLTGDEPPITAQKLSDVGALQGAYLSRPELITAAYPDLPYGGTVHWRTTSADIGRLTEWLEQGPVVIETEFIPGGATPPTDQHFVIALELDGDDLIVADPWTGKIVRLLEHYASANWDIARAIYGARLIGITDGEAPDTVEPLYDNLLGLHIQKPMGGIPEYCAASSPSVFKTVQNFQTCVGIKEVSPETLTIIRPYPNDVRGVGAVRDIVAGIADDLRVLHPYIDYVELINEQVASNDPAGTRLAVETEIAGMEALKALGVPVKPLILNVAVGNPWGPWDPVNEQLLLLPALQAAEALFGPGGYAVGYHSYWPSNLTATYLTYADVNGKRSYVGKYFAFRALEWDKDFAAHGIYPNYIQTEMGPMGTHGPRPDDGYIDMLGYDGWKSGRCLGGNRTRLIDELAQWQATLAAWNVTHNNRVLGGTIFTTGGGSKWATFAFEQPEMEAWTARY